MKKIGVICGKDSVQCNNYFAAVTAAGGEVVPIDAYAVEPDIGLIIGGVEGLLISGGVDLQPFYYHEENVACGTLDPVLDDFEMKAMSEAVKQNKPVLGICRGMQLINVFFGGSLYQNIFCCEFHKRYENKDRVHRTKVESGTFLEQVYGKTEIAVNSAHHQAVKVLADDLVPAQYSNEGILEAFYHKDKPIFAVQWHPERMCLANAREDTEDGLKLFKFFVDML